MSAPIGSGSALVKIIAALFKNKLRFGDNASKGKRIGTIILLALAYAAILTISVFLSVTFGRVMRDAKENAGIFYFIALFTGSLIVLVFGVIHLVSTLFLSKDTDFYSSLPVKSWVVFAAKLLYVYISETAIVVAVLLPMLTVYGAVVGVWAGYYVITFLTILIVPAFPLAVAAIIAVPVMFIAGKLKNRGIIAIVFYVLLFAAMFGMYFYFLYSVTSMTESVTPEQIMRLIRIVRNIGYALYPYLALSSAAFGTVSFGLSFEASVVANIAIFLAISIGLLAVLLALAKFMYARSAKANNQTNNSQARKGEFKSGGTLKALMKREYAVALRTTQTTFQCFVVFFLPIMFAVTLGIMSSKLFAMVLYESGNMSSPPPFIYAVMAAILSSTANASFTTFSREGEYVESLKVLPLAPKKIVWAKMLSWLVFAVPSALISAIIFNAFSFDPLNFGLSVVAFPLLAAAFGVFGVLWDLKAPKLKWTDAAQAIKHNSHATIGMLLCMAGSFLLMMINMFLMDNDFIDYGTMITVIWCGLFAEILIFAVADVILYRKLDIYYARMRV